MALRRPARLLLWATAGIVLGLVFMAYMSPHLAVDLANRVWACF
jgi:hypothetical protein